MYPKLSQETKFGNIKGTLKSRLISTRIFAAKGKASAVLGANPLILDRAPCVAVIDLNSSDLIALLLFITSNYLFQIIRPA